MSDIDDPRARRFNRVTTYREICGLSHLRAKHGNPTYIVEPKLSDEPERSVMIYDKVCVPDRSGKRDLIDCYCTKTPLSSVSYRVYTVTIDAMSRLEERYYFVSDDVTAWTAADCQFSVEVKETFETFPDLRILYSASEEALRAIEMDMSWTLPLEFVKSLEPLPEI